MRALLLVDIQNDFLPGGSLAVPRGDEIIPLTNRLMQDYPLVVATQDWHPPDHLSFASQHPERRMGESVQVDGLTQILWPDHCIQGTHGAEISPSLDLKRITQVVQKGTDRRVDSYSGFFDNARRHSTGLSELLHQFDVRELHIVGLATEYCVLFTALDAVEQGFKTTVLLAAVRGIDLQPGDVDRALDTMQAAQVVLAN